MRPFKTDKESIWVRYMKRRIQLNKNFIGFVSGPTGSGKSLSSLSMAEQCDPRFSINNVVFRFKELMELINSGSLRKGSAIVFEEAGIEMDATKWQSKLNRVIRYLMETFRHRNFIMILNAPYMDFVDSGTRRLFHAEFETKGINYHSECCIIKPMLLQYNGRVRKWYYKYLRVAASESLAPVKRWSVHKPSADLIKEYELKKKDFTTKLNKEIEEQIDEEKNKKKPTKWQLRCRHCSYSWKSNNENPKRCPRCKSYKWNIKDQKKRWADLKNMGVLE